MTNKTYWDAIYAAPEAGFWAKLLGADHHDDYGHYLTVAIFRDGKPVIVKNPFYQA